MDGIAPNNEILNALCSRVSRDTHNPYYMALDSDRHLEFLNDCAECFRSAVQLIDEGVISEDEYRYIIGMAFTTEAEVTYYSL